MVTMTTTDVDNNPVRERQANENLYLNFEIVQLPAGFTAIEVLDVDMYMIAEQWGDIITIPLMKDGCPTQNSQAFGFAVSPRELTPNGARIPMTAVPVFENIPGEYFFNYRLKLCKNKAVCEKDPTCPSLNPKPLPTGEIFKHKQQGLLIN
ncbi:hypothetical protein FSP39_020259 [Pinctada imbricata]|uniref:Uncharacterized protein n=1 Tax=Pinctada imbricata TaxID=66713 RepID=A0AA89C2Q1_PINIB|nr:hypothetical protein FSP39_020259 [Pinctada imbricata]